MMSRRSLALYGLAVLLAAIIGFGAVRLSTTSAGSPIIISNDALSQRIAVQVRGAVVSPGMYWLEGDARVQAAIDAAGGALPDADLSGVNLARRIRDEEQLEIAFAGAVATPIGDAAPTTATSIASSSATGTKININRASVDELDGLPGIGPALAQRIVSYRQQHGPFSSVEELSNVSGISPKMVEALRPLVTITP